MIRRKTVLTMYVENDQYERAKEIATQTRLPMSVLVRDALAIVLKRFDTPEKTATELQRLGVSHGGDHA